MVYILEYARKAAPVGPEPENWQWVSVFDTFEKAKNAFDMNWDCFDAPLWRVILSPLNDDVLGTRNIIWTSRTGSTLSN